ncbi:BatA domain-containing protein [Telluribacter sp. SYSU D00476]|uniref:BatA domain-containing protein n=1 Tax=Telluribacter sp. SYSU D00476 TaxID=2811430 RepID=UPI001FF54AE8|nr:BatA domain-containing protein [Telluribacter sp. SYSU D00476]
MELLQPVMLWGALAIAIPILIHFWHQKRGKVLAWATTQWLLTKNQQQHRGLRLDNLPLLLLRCLVLLVLTLLLSRPVLDRWSTTPISQQIHLVQPDPYVTDNYRFELEEALKKGEKVYWIHAPVSEVQELTALPEAQSLNSLQIQAAINQLRQTERLDKAAELHLYLLNQQELSSLPFIQVPSGFQLHAVADTSRRPVQEYVELSNGQKLFINTDNRLTTGPTLPAAKRFQVKPIHRGSLAVRLDYTDQVQQRIVEAALKALTEVFNLPMAIDKEPQSHKRYDWVFTDRAPVTPPVGSIYVVSNGGKEYNIGNISINTLPNVVYTGESLHPQTSELVANGQLPEWLGELLVSQYSLQKRVRSLSERELKALFVKSERDEALTADSGEQVQKALLLLFILLVGLERWVALTKNA